MARQRARESRTSKGAGVKSMVRPRVTEVRMWGAYEKVNVKRG